MNFARLRMRRIVRMFSLFLSLLLSMLCGLPALAQYAPTPGGLYMNVGGAWTPNPAASGTGAISFTPSAVGAYCLSTSTQMWSPCVFGATNLVMTGLDYWLQFTDLAGSTIKDFSGSHNATISGSGYAWRTPVGLDTNGATAAIPAAAGRPSFGYCAFFPAGGGSANYGYVSSSAVGGQNGYNLQTSYGVGTDHGPLAWFPQIGHSNGGPNTTAVDGFTGTHCVEAIAGGTQDHIIVDGSEVTYQTQGSSSDTVGGGELTNPMNIASNATLYSAWGTTGLDTVSQAIGRTRSEMARLTSMGVAFSYTPSAAADSTCSIDGTSIDQGFQANNVPPSSLLALDFPCTGYGFMVSGQAPKDMDAAFAVRAAPVFHPKAAKNIAYHGGVTNGVVNYQESPQNAYLDVLSWNRKAHALGYKTIVSTMLSRTGTGYNALSGDVLAQQFNAILLANADEFDWLDNVAAWPQLGATGAYASTTYFADGIHPNTTGQALYVAAERAAFEGVYGKAKTLVNTGYTQAPADRFIIAGTPAALPSGSSSSANIYNVTGWQPDILVSNTDGTYSSHTGYGSSPYMVVQGLTAVSSNTGMTGGAFGLAFYDGSKVYISGYSTSCNPHAGCAGWTTPVPVNAVFAVFGETTADNNFSSGGSSVIVKAGSAVPATPYVAFVAATNGPTTPYAINLMDANTANFNSNGRLCVKDAGAVTVTLTPVSGETIDGAASLTLASGASACIVPSIANPAAGGANWIRQ